MRKKRVFLDGAMYHVTSRTNGREKVFEHKPGKVIMMAVLKEAKEKYGFTVSNFCIMPTHIHLLITPKQGSDLSKIMLWIKTNFTKKMVPGTFFSQVMGGCFCGLYTGFYAGRLSL